MIAASRYGQPPRRGDRFIVIIMVGLVHLGLALVLVSGFTVRIDPQAENPLQLIDVRLPRPPPPPPPPPPKVDKAKREAAAKAIVAPKGGTKAPEKIKRQAPVVPKPKIVMPTPKVASGGGAAGRGGPSAGFGAGGGQGGNGNGDGDGEGGSDLVQIAGGIGPGDYPPELRSRGIGGEVSVSFTVLPNGRAARCAVTRSSGVTQLDALTCRLIEQRFVYRPSTDRSGRPVSAIVDHDQAWISRARN